MKPWIVSVLSLFPLCAFACPKLNGDFFCYGDPSLARTTFISESSGTVRFFDGAYNHIVDGKTHAYNQAPYEGGYRASCQGDTTLTLMTETPGHAAPGYDDKYVYSMTADNNLKIFITTSGHEDQDETVICNRVN